MTRHLSLLAMATFLASCASHQPTTIARSEPPRQTGVEPEPRPSWDAVELAEPAAEPAWSQGWEREPVLAEDLLAEDPYADASLVAGGETADLLELSRSYYLAGLDDLERGAEQAACENFELALAVLTQAGPGLEDPTLRVAYLELSAHLDAVMAGVDVGSGGELADSAADQIAGLELPEASDPTAVPSSHQPLQLLVGDMPLEVNNQVERMLEIYTGQLKDFIAEAFVRSGRYLPMVREIFAEEGVPLDIAWLALVESAYKPNAYSRARAKGLWQFIQSTGRMYGLDVDWWVDERSDPEKATRAAARHLKDLYADLGDWYLAFAAYNAGTGKVKRAIRRVGSRDYWRLARTRHLRRETRNYVPAYLATLLIANDPKAHGFDFELDPPLEWDVVEVPSPLDLRVVAERSDVELDLLKQLNPELRRSITPGNHASYQLKVPRGQSAPMLAVIEAIPENQRLRVVHHRVARGETLGRIASRYGSTVSAVRAANNIRNPNLIQPGRMLVIPTGDSLPPSRTASSGRSKQRASNGATGSRKNGSAQSGDAVVHVVRRGETLSKIARRYRTSATSLVSWNRLSSPDRIHPGMRLKVYPGQRTRTTRASTRTISYRVRRGDTLARIARRHNTSVDQLVASNKLRSPDRISPGMRLKIEPGSGSGSRRSVTHKVRRGDSLYTIARNYGVTVRQLRSWNGLGRSRYIHPGDRLNVYLPGREN